MLTIPTRMRRPKTTPAARPPLKKNQIYHSITNAWLILLMLVILFCSSDIYQAMFNICPNHFPNQDKKFKHKHMSMLLNMVTIVTESVVTTNLEKFSPVK